MFYPQGNFHSQANLGYPQGGIGYPQGGFGQQSSQATPNAVPFANALYGYPQQTPYFAQGFAQSSPQVSNWQHLAQQQAALQQQALLHLLAPQLAQQANGGIANGAGPYVAGWQQPQTNPEQFNPAVLQQPQHHLQRLAQYHYSVAQQFAQLAAQYAAHNSGNPYAGQFIPGTGQFIPSQLGANFVPGITMH
jgi:hypothetical protein